MEFYGRNDTNTKVIFPADQPIQTHANDDSTKRLIQPGDFIVAKITESTSQVLKGIALYHSSISEFNRSK